MNDAPPVIWRSGRTSIPGVDIGTTNIVRPRCLAASGSVRARHRPMSARWALEVQTFWPSRTQLSPSRVARVRTPARSEPASGSENSWQARTVAAVDADGELPLVLLGAVGHEGRGDGADADAQRDHVGHGEAGLEGAVEPVVGQGQAASAVVRRAGDPAEPGVEALPLPGPGGGHLGGLLGGGRLVEDGHRVRTLRPRPAPPASRRRNGALEELPGLLLERRLVGRWADSRVVIAARRRCSSAGGTPRCRPVRLRRRGRWPSSRRTAPGAAAAPCR